MKVNKLYSTKNIADLLSIHRSTVLNRAETLKLNPITFDGSESYFFDQQQFEKIRDFQKKIEAPTIINKRIDTIVHHVEWHIRDSKLNFLTLQQLAEWDNHRKYLK